MKKCLHCGRENEDAVSSCTSCGRSEFAELEAPPKPASKGRPWVGVLLSLLIPGFGMLRGGLPGQALAWFVGLELGLAFVALAFAIENVPFMLAMAAGAAWFLGWLCMLSRSYRGGKMTLRLWVAFVLLLALTAVWRSPVQFIAKPFKFSTASMRPTLEAGSGQEEYLIVDRVSYRLGSPRRGDLLVFRTTGISGMPQDEIYVKRLIGMPGERLEIRDGCIFANGTRLTQREGIPPIHFVTREAAESGNDRSSASYEVEAEGYFVLGDNSTNSLDSRYFGCVPRKNVYGKVTGIYYPFSRAGRPRFPGEPDGAANRSQPVGSETNRRSTAAGPSR